LAVDWLNDDHTLGLKLPPTPQLKLQDFATVKSFEEARDKASDSVLRWGREARTYVLDFDPDGSFHADDVPPGTYQLRIHVTKPETNRVWSPFPNPDNELGLLEREVVVPPGDGPFDLGKLIVNIKDTVASERPAAANFTGHALDGRSVSLSQYRGKYLLLTFWATWSDRCAEQLENVRKLEDQLNRDDRIAFLGVSLDEDTNSVRQTIESRGYKWTQAQLDSGSLAKATGKFDVSSLPAIYLIDTKGRVVASNLEGDRLRSTVQRELKN
jgi:peroxiredoxin